MLPSVQLPSSNAIWCQFYLEKDTCLLYHWPLVTHFYLCLAFSSAYDSTNKTRSGKKKKKSVCTAQKIDTFCFQIQFFNKISFTCCFGSAATLIFESTQVKGGQHWGRNKTQRIEIGHFRLQQKCLSSHIISLPLSFTNTEKLYLTTRNRKHILIHPCQLYHFFRQINANRFVTAYKGLTSFGLCLAVSK